MTIAALIGLGVVGYIAYQHRDRFMPQRAAATPIVAKKLSEDAERKFFEARDAIVGGKYDEASALLTAIDTDKAPQPARNWITMQNGLARLLAGKLPEARAEFARVEQRGFFTKDPRQEKLAAFFVNAARAAAGEEPVKAEDAKTFDTDSTEAFAYLILGLKDWMLGSYDDSARLLGEFKTATPPDSEIWLRRYRGLADAYVTSYAAYAAAVEASKDVSSHERKEGALKSIADAKAKLGNQPGLVARLGEIEGKLKEQVETVKMERKKVSDEAEAADQKILDDVKTRVAAFNAKYNFGDALQIVFTATVDGDRAKAELDSWLKRTQWLSKFKLKIVSDVNSGGYAKPLEKKDGITIATGAKTADDNELTTPAKATVAWHDLTPETVAAIAKDFLNKEKDADAIVERKWLLGNFLYEIGKKADALALLREAGEAKPEYKDSLKLFPADEAK